MSAESTGSVLLDHYRNISNKLKRRFLRKPNVTEACESFTMLGKHCENDEMPAYAGLCWIAAAQCEGSLANIPGETSCLRRAAQQFLLAEQTAHKIGCPTPSNEGLHAALSCYAHATTRYPNNTPMLCINVNIEIVDAIKKLQCFDKEEMYLKNALQLSEECLEVHIYSLENLGCYYIKSGNYVSALDIFTQLTNFISATPDNAARYNILLTCEINRVFILLILKPVAQSLSADLTRILEKYMWNDKMDKSLIGICMTETLFILIQSLVLACQSMDVSSIMHLENELWTHLNAVQKELLRVLVHTY